MHFPPIILYIIKHFINVTDCLSRILLQAFKYGAPPHGGLAKIASTAEFYIRKIHENTTSLRENSSSAMKITGGKYKGRKIESSKDPNVRPTMSRAREAFFNMIMHSDLFSFVSDITGKSFESKAGKKKSILLHFPKSIHDFYLARKRLALLPSLVFAIG